jgi:hypothetical protein
MYMKGLVPQVDRQHLHSFLVLPNKIAKKRPRSGNRPSHTAMCESVFATIECKLIDRLRFRSHVEATRSPAPPCSAISTAKKLLKLAPALRRNEPAFQQDRTKLIDQSPSLTDQPV